MNRGLNIDAARAAMGRPVLSLDQLFAKNRAVFGDLRMEDPDDKGKGPDDTDKGGKGDDDKGKPAAKFDQAQVDRFTGTARNEGRQAAMKELADELGVTLDEAKEIVKAKQAKDDEARTEAEKAQRAATTEKTAAETEKAAAAAERHAAKVERILMRQGLVVPDGDDADPDAFITTAVGLVTSKVGDDDDAIKAAVDKLKTTMPPLFTKAADKDDDDKGDGSFGPGAGPRGGSQRTGVFGEKGLAEAQRRGWVDKDGKPIDQHAKTA